MTNAEQGGSISADLRRPRPCLAQEVLRVSEDIGGPDTCAKYFSCQALLDHGQVGSDDVSIQQLCDRTPLGVCRRKLNLKGNGGETLQRRKLPDKAQALRARKGERIVRGAEYSDHAGKRGVRVGAEEKQCLEGRIRSMPFRAVGKYRTRIELTQDGIRSPINQPFRSRGFVRNPLQEIRDCVRANIPDCFLALRNSQFRRLRIPNQYARDVPSRIPQPLAQPLPFVAWFGRRERPNQNPRQRQGDCDQQKMKPPLAHAARCLSCPAQARADCGTKDENGMREVSARLRAVAHQSALMSTYERP